MNIGILTSLMTEENMTQISEVLAVGDVLAVSLKPKVEALSRFKTRLDIEAVKEMEAAGLTTEQAVMLRSSFNMNIARMFNK